MKVPENFKTRIGGNFYAETPNLVVYSDATILRVDRDDGGDLPLTYMIDSLRASMITNNPPIAWINMGISLAFSVAILIIGILLTKLSED